MDPVDLLPRLTVLLLGVAIVIIGYSVWRDYRRQRSRPIALDHDHNHHGLIWVLLVLLLLGICGPGGRQGPQGPPGYLSRTTYRAGERIPVLLDGNTVGSVFVDEIFP